MAEEKQFEVKVKKYLHSLGIYAAGTPSQNMGEEQHGWYFKVWGGGFQKSGIPDMIICANGFFISVELKSSIGRPSELQKLNSIRINQSNGIAIILYPEGFEEFKKIIKGVIQCKVHIPELNYLKNAGSNTKCVILTK